MNSESNIKGAEECIFCNGSGCESCLRLGFIGFGKEDYNAEKLITVTPNFPEHQENHATHFIVPEGTGLSNTFEALDFNCPECGQCWDIQQAMRIVDRFITKSWAGFTARVITFNKCSKCNNHYLLRSSGASGSYSNAEEQLRSLVRR